MDYSQIIFGSLNTLIVGWLVIRMTKHMDQSDIAIKHLVERNDTQDDALTVVIGSHFDSSKIAKGLQVFPSFHKKPLRDS